MMKQPKLSAATPTPTAKENIEKPYLRGIGRQLGNITARLEKIETTLRKESSLTHQLAEALKDPDNWIVWGQVCDSGGGVPDLIVKLFDKDICSEDDPLGETCTNSEGEFLLVYKASDFQDFFDKKPDLYLRVIDKKDQIRCEWQTPVKCNAGRFERFDITLGEQPAPG
jgi:hypothetical protein